MSADFSITTEERSYLRELAKKQLEYARLPVMKERESGWYRHNDLKGGKPVVTFETFTCLQDLLPPLKCISAAARQIEHQLACEIAGYELIDDDNVVSGFFGVYWRTGMTLFDSPVERDTAEDSSGMRLGHRFKYAIRNLKEDMGVISKPTRYVIDKDYSLKFKAFADEIIGDILPAKFIMGSLYCVPTQDIVHLMGMENMIFSMIDYPDEFHRLMQKICESYINYFELLRKEKVLVLNNNNNYVGNGTRGFTHDLPGKGFDVENGIGLNDLWGFMDSQETLNLSPGMFGEFVFPYYQNVARLFGLLSYGCCEPVHPYWDDYIGRLPNLRKVSVSPWCDERFMGDRLRGSNIIYHRKISPNYVGVGKELDEEAFAAHIKKTLECARGCRLEFSFRDVYTLSGNKAKPKRAVQIIRHLMEKYYQPV